MGAGIREIVSSEFEDRMRNVAIYTKGGCPYCLLAKQLLARRGVTFDEIDISVDRPRRQEMIERSGRYTVPQIFVGAFHVGGCDDLYELESSRMLDDLLSPEPLAEEA